ncbi:MAG: hypothetical protein SF051_07160 [Elusimicrobiota bacterium]|nr:hypothetical protein [Elusimicrobiota bacterium]
MTALLLALALPASADCRDDLAAKVAAAAARRPALAGLSIETRLFRHDSDFGQAWPGSAWRAPASRRYLVRLNERLCGDPPPAAALDALILHELAHVEDYSRRSAFSLLRLGWSYLRDDESAVAAHERAMDDAVVEAGGAGGLLMYRRWMLERVTPEAAARKRRVYRMPEELAALTLGRR